MEEGEEMEKRNLAKKRKLEFLQRAVDLAVDELKDDLSLVDNRKNKNLEECKSYKLFERFFFNFG